jgi:hypothetical protein
MQAENVRARVYVYISRLKEKKTKEEYIFVPSAFVVIVTMLSKLNNVRAG